MTAQLDCFSATSRRWPNATKKEINFLLSVAKETKKFIRVSSAKLNSCKWGPYYGLVTYILLIGKNNYPIFQAKYSAGREFRSLDKALRKAKRSKYPIMPMNIGAVDPTKFWTIYHEQIFDE